MEQIEKDLLLKDLSARLPYGVKCKYEYSEFVCTLEVISKDNATLRGENGLWHTCAIEHVKPYLLPLSSMTEEQRNEFNKLTKTINIHQPYTSVYDIFSASYIDGFGQKDVYYVDLEEMLIVIDWLNAHHFDFRGLIEKGLAIDATGLNIY